MAEISAAVQKQSLEPVEREPGRRKFLAGAGVAGVGAAFLSGNAKAWTDATASGNTATSPLPSTPASDTAAIQAQINALYASGGGVLLLDASKKYYITGNLEIKAGVTLAGYLTRPDFKRQFTATPIDSNDLLFFGSQLVLAAKNAASPGSITLRSSAALTNVLITAKGLHAGLPRPQGDFANGFDGGTALTLEGEGSCVKDCFIGGFDLAVHSKQQRPVIDGVWGDNINGILVVDASDVARVSNCHFCPWLTNPATYPNSGSPTATPSNSRAGYAFKVTETATGLNSWSRLHNCFCYGYFRGYWMEGGENFTFTLCGADHVPRWSETIEGTKGGAELGAIGFLLSCGPSETRFDTCQVAAQQVGFLVQNPNGQNKSVFINNCDVFANQYGIHNGGSDCTLRISGCVIRTVAGTRYTQSNGIVSNGSWLPMIRDTTVKGYGSGNLYIGTPPGSPGYQDLGGNLFFPTL